MKHKVAYRILDAQEMLQSEHSLIAEYEYCQIAFLNMLPQLSGAQQNILLDYLGVCVELHLRMLELCCETEQEK